MDDPRWSTSAAFLDYDRDGDLDLFVANYVAFTVAGNKVCTDHAGARDYCPPGRTRRCPTRLFRNDGGGRFHGCDRGLRRRRAPTAPGWAWRSATSMTTAGPTSTWPTTRRPNQLWINQRRRHVRGSRAPLGHRSERGRAARRQHGHRPRRCRQRRRRGSLRHATSPARRMRSYVNDGAGNFEDARVQAGPRRADGGDDRLRHRAGSTTTTTAGSICSSPTAPSTSSSASADRPVPYRQHNLLFHNEGRAYSATSAARRASSSRVSMSASGARLRRYGQ